MARNGSPDAVIDVLKHSNLTDMTLMRKVAQTSRTDGQIGWSATIALSGANVLSGYDHKHVLLVSCYFQAVGGKGRANCAVRASRKRLAAARGDSKVLQRCSM